MGRRIRVAGMVAAGVYALALGGAAMAAVDLDGPATVSARAAEPSTPDRGAWPPADPALTCAAEVRTDQVTNPQIQDAVVEREVVTLSTVGQPGSDGAAPLEWDLVLTKTLIVDGRRQAITPEAWLRWERAPADLYDLYYEGGLPDCA